MSKMWINNAKKAAILEGGRAYLNTLELRLYINNIALSGTVGPVAGSDEPPDGAYVPVANPFPMPAVTAGTVGRLEGVEPAYVWDHDAGDFDIYGAFFTDPADSDEWVLAQAAPTPFAVVAPGQVYIPRARVDLDRIV